MSTRTTGSRIRKKVALHHGESLADAGARFVDAWHRAEKGEPYDVITAEMRL